MEWHEGDIIRKLREQMKWTLGEYARRTGVNASVIHRLERGYTRETKRSTLARLVQPFGFTVSDLLAAVPKPSPLVLMPVNKRNDEEARTAERPRKKRRAV